MAAAARRDLLRQVGLRSATALVVANIVGSGIFTTTGFQADALGDPVWIRESPGQQRGDELCWEAWLARLVSLRCAAAQLRFEGALSQQPAGADPGALSQLWAEELENASSRPARAVGFLEGADAELASLHVLRGQALAAQLAEHLRERYGRAFWRERRCGELLKELWHTGSDYTAEGIASELGFAPLDLDHVTEQLVRAP